MCIKCISFWKHRGSKSKSKSDADSATETGIDTSDAPEEGTLYELEGRAIASLPPNFSLPLGSDGSLSSTQVECPQYSQYQQETEHDQGFNTSHDTTTSHPLTTNPTAAHLSHALLFTTLPPYTPATPPVPKRTFFVLAMDAGDTWAIPVYASASSSMPYTPPRRTDAPRLTLTIPQRERGDQYKSDIAKTGGSGSASGYGSGNLFGLSRQQRTTRKFSVNAGARHRRTKSAGAAMSADTRLSSVRSGRVGQRGSGIVSAGASMNVSGSGAGHGVTSGRGRPSTLTIRTKSLSLSQPMNSAPPRTTRTTHSSLSALTPLFPPRPLSDPILWNLSTYLPPLSSTSTPFPSPRPSISISTQKPRYYTSTLSLADKNALAQSACKIWSAADTLQHFEARKALLPRDMEKVRKGEVLGALEWEISRVKKSEARIVRRSRLVKVAEEV